MSGIEIGGMGSNEGAMASTKGRIDKEEGGGGEMELKGISG
jgi:hypothetical protein